MALVSKLAGSRNLVATSTDSEGHDFPTYLTETQFCERYHVRPRTAQRWRATGDGPKWVRLGLRKVCYRIGDCEDWAKARTFQSRADELSCRASV